MSALEKLSSNVTFDTCEVDLSYKVKTRCTICNVQFEQDLTKEHIEYICPDCDEELNKE